MPDERVWRNRLWMSSAVSLGGFAIFMVGIAIIYTDLLREGGWPQVGAIVAILGAIDAFLAPRILRKGWAAQDREQK